MQGCAAGRRENRFLLDWRGSVKDFRSPNAEGNLKKRGEREVRA